MENIKLNYTVQKDDFLNMGRVSNNMRQKLKELGFSPEIIRRVATVLYQGEINMLIHAGGGKIDIEINEQCITMTLADKGPGIENIEEALADGYSTASDRARSLGFGEGTGFSSMKKFSDEMQIYSEPGIGTTLIMKIFIGKNKECQDAASNLMQYSE